jgi:hypothetical protein
MPRSSHFLISLSNYVCTAGAYSQVKSFFLATDSHSLSMLPQGLPYLLHPSLEIERKSQVLKAPVRYVNHTLNTSQAPKDLEFNFDGNVAMREKKKIRCVGV